MRKPNPDEIYQNIEVNMSSNYYKWQVISYRQIKNNQDFIRYLYVRNVITLTHAETGGILCYDELSAKRVGNPCYVRIFKG